MPPHVLNVTFEIRLLDEELEPAFGTFLERIAADPGNTFHPHPLTRDAARELCSSRNADLRYVAIAAGQVMAYGLLRGWDEGYDVPSLGIAVDPDFRARGIGRLLMEFLHEAARLRRGDQVPGCGSRRRTCRRDTCTSGWDTNSGRRKGVSSSGSSSFSAREWTAVPRSDGRLPSRICESTVTRLGGRLAPGRGPALQRSLRHPVTRGEPPA